MQNLIEKFEQSIVYIAIAVIYAISVFHPDVNVNEGAITELTIIVLAILAGTGKVTDVVSWFAIRFDFGDVTKLIIREFENRTGNSLPQFVKDQLVQIADDFDAQMTPTETSSEAQVQYPSDNNIDPNLPVSG